MARSFPQKPAAGLYAPPAWGAVGGRDQSGEKVHAAEEAASESSAAADSR